ncbi:MAG: hypothetical protein ACOH1I_11960 [Gallionellaceae bacterium]
MHKKTWRSCSSGKDSAWALLDLRQSGENALGLPLHLIATHNPCFNEQYAAVMTGFRAQAGRDGFVFADCWLRVD